MYRQPYANLTYRIDLKHGNSILDFFNFRKSYVGFWTARTPDERADGRSVGRSDSDVTVTDGRTDGRTVG